MKLIIPLLFVVCNCYSQTNYAYFRTALDLNNALGIIDNPRTVEEVLGLDFDVEIGARFKSVGVYATYGRFEKQDYQNYAVGLDYYVDIIKGVETAIGANYGIILRRDNNYYISEFDPIKDAVWTSYKAVAFRGVAKINITKNISVPMVLQYQRRPELKKFVLEGAIGIEIKLNINR